MLNGRRIALIEDDEVMGGSIAQRLMLEGAEVVWIKLAQRAIGALRTPRAPIDLVICDIRLPDGTGEEVYSVLCQTATPPPFLFITGQGGIDQAVRLLQAGAADYITKPFDMTKFLDRLLILLQPKIKQPGQSLELVGISQAARRVEHLIALAGGHDEPVLVRGAVGTGKALVAMAVHQGSDRAAAPFVHVNLARSQTPSQDLLEAMADVGEGCLFLNGLEYLGAEDQTILMRWLDRSPECRLISACGAGIEEAVRAGRTRSDLAFRLGQHEIPIPPLRDRPEDAVWLLHRLFVPLNVRRAHPLRGISALTDQAAASHDWPGNGRELRTRLIQALAAAAGEWLFPSDLFAERIADTSSHPLLSLSEARAAAERSQIIAALERADGQLAKAASLLKVSRTTLWEKMQKLGL